MIARRIVAVAAILSAVHGLPCTAVAQQSGRARDVVTPREIRGRVINGGDSTPVVGAELRVGARVVARSDDDGGFVIAAGDHDALGSPIDVRALGFVRRTLTLAPPFVIALERLPTVLSSVVTTAGQRTMSGAATTASVTTIERKQIDASAAVAANQLLRQLPGLQEIPSPPSKTSISIRGLDAARVLVLVDGEPTSGTLIDNRDIGRLSTLAAQRIEVTKGPSAVEFGSDALGGVINLVTAAPTDRFTVDAMGRGGALGRKESSVGVSQTIGRVGYRVNGGWRQTDRVTAIDAIGSTLERVYDLRSDVRYRVTDRVSLRADVQGSRERQRWPVGGGYNGFIDNRTLQGLIETRVGVSGGDLRLRAFTQDYSYRYRQAAGDVPIAGSADSLEQTESLQRALVSYSRVAGANSIDAGVQFSARELVAPEKVTGNRATDRITEAFARDAVQMGPLLANIGVRLTSSTLWGESVNPSVGAAWQASDRLRFRANVARGFRAPSFKEIRYTFFNAGGGYTIVGNAALEPEASWSTSAGITVAPASRLSLDVEGYRNALSDLIDTRLTGVNPAGYQIYQNVNVAKARTSGVETAVRYTGDAFEASLGYDYLDTRDFSNALPLGRRAKHTARVALGRDWSVLRGITTDVIGRYTGRAPLIGSDANGTARIVGYQGEFLSLDAQLRANVSPTTELSAGVNNALGQRPALFTPAYDRQVYAGVRIRWMR